MAATAQPANVTQDAASSRASTGAPTLPTDDTVASLPGAVAPAEPATLVDVDTTHSGAGSILTSAGPVWDLRVQLMEHKGEDH
jgi:hypothetical protein